jgi:hypothetical protein
MKGSDADIIVWEQTYHCASDVNNQLNYAVEQFLRQALFIPTQPIIAYSQSYTPNW